MRNNTRSNTRRTKPNKVKHCALLDKPCMGDDCAQHFDKFGKCSFELIPYNIYPLTVAMQELVEINHDLLAALDDLSSKLKDKKSEQTELFA